MSFFQEYEKLKKLKEESRIEYDSYGTERWYDSNGKLTHYKNSRGYEYWYDYDSNGNETHYKESSGYEKWYEYDSNGNKTHSKNSNGYEVWNEYDSNGKLTHSKNSNGTEVRYDSSGKEIPNPNDTHVTVDTLRTVTLQHPQGHLRT